jgi:hypothetical protein
MARAFNGRFEAVWNKWIEEYILKFRIDDTTLPQTNLNEQKRQAA